MCLTTTFVGGYLRLVDALNDHLPVLLVDVTRLDAPGFAGPTSDRTSLGVDLRDV